MKLETCMLTENPCYGAGRTITPQGIMVHSLGVAQPNPDVFISQWNRRSAKVAVHAIVGQSRIIQLLPWQVRAWHCGGAGNNTHIAMELCEPAGHTYQGGTMVGYDAERQATFFSDVYWNAVKLAADLCSEFGFDPYTNILCHCEGHARGIASNHADVMHWFPKHGKSMDKFRSDVARVMKGALLMNKETKRDKVQVRFGLADQTIDFLQAYKYGEELLRKLAEGK